MKIRITDIPAEGKKIDFDIELESFQNRVNFEGQHEVSCPTYCFESAPHSDLNLELEGTTVLLRGVVTARCKTACARCTEDASIELKVPVEMVLKPFSSERSDEVSEEDVAFGFYDGKEVNCAPFAEEALLLALPYAVLCKPECKGLCSQCGKNLNLDCCDCHEEKQGDPRFSVLRGLKLN